jgi:hypothetical protein
MYLTKWHVCITTVTETQKFTFIVVGIDVAANNTEELGVAM